MDVSRQDETASHPRASRHDGNRGIRLADRGGLLAMWEPSRKQRCDHKWEPVYNDGTSFTEWCRKCDAKHRRAARWGDPKTEMDRIREASYKRIDRELKKDQRKNQQRIAPGGCLIYLLGALLITALLTLP
jgi:hypothetical protein